MSDIAEQSAPGKIRLKTAGRCQTASPVLTRAQLFHSEDERFKPALEAGSLAFDLHSENRAKSGMFSGQGEEAGQFLMGEKETAHRGGGRLPRRQYIYLGVADAYVLDGLARSQFIGFERST